VENATLLLNSSPPMEINCYFLPFEFRFIPQVTE